MSLTRFHDDPARIMKRAQESSFLGNYRLNVPGNGTHLPFHEDPHIRLQRWGANINNQDHGMIHLESDLRGMTRKLNKDVPELNNYQTYAETKPTFSYPTTSAFIDESRATHPAFLYRESTQSRWETPFLNPQDSVKMEGLPFHSNLQTRILEKDSFVPY